MSAEQKDENFRLQHINFHSENDCKVYFMFILHFYKIQNTRKHMNRVFELMPQVQKTFMKLSEKMLQEINL